MDKKRNHILSLWHQVCFNDDVKAFESFYYMLYNPLVKFSMMYIHQKEEAEEIVTDVFVKIWNNRSNMQHIECADTYLFVAVKNQSLNYLKKYSTIHIVPIEDSDEVNLIDISNPHIQLEKKELHFYLDQSIASLPQQCRIIFKLIKEDGLKYKEVAEILSISPSTVKTQLSRAMQKLNTCLIGYSGLPSRYTINKDVVINILIMLAFAKIFF